MTRGELISTEPLRDDCDLFATKPCPLSLKLRPCLTALDTLRKTEDGTALSSRTSRLFSPRSIRAISSSMENAPSALCFGKPLVRQAGERGSSDLVSMLCNVLMDSLFLCLSTGGGGGGCLGMTKSPLATDLLGPDGRLEARGGGASKLPRRGGDSTGFE